MKYYEYLYWKMINITKNCYSNIIKLGEIFFKKYQNIINSIYCNKLNVITKNTKKINIPT